MRLSPTEKRARELSAAVKSIGSSTKPSLSERAGVMATMRGIPNLKGADGKTPVRGVDYFTKEDIDALKEEMLSSDHITEVIKAMQKLPEANRLDVSGIRNFQSFIYGGQKYGVHELMHGAGASSSSGITIIAVTGTIDDSNVTFAATAEPTLLNINGAFYDKTGGAITWTYVVGVITLSSPIGTGGAIFGI